MHTARKAVSREAGGGAGRRQARELPVSRLGALGVCASRPRFSPVEDLVQQLHFFNSYKIKIFNKPKDYKHDLPCTDTL